SRWPRSTPASTGGTSSRSGPCVRSRTGADLGGVAKVPHSTHRTGLSEHPLPRAGAAHRCGAAEPDVEGRGRRALRPGVHGLRHPVLRGVLALAVAAGLADLAVAQVVDAVADDGARPAPAARVAGVRRLEVAHAGVALRHGPVAVLVGGGPLQGYACIDRKSTRLNSSHVKISYAVFCHADIRDLRSFPTRRSSDLAGLADLAVAQVVDAVADDGARPAPAARVAGVRRLEVAHAGVALRHGPVAVLVGGGPLQGYAC